ncbi:AAA family ATPase [Geomicrobium sp. JCM 19039]|uniref:AAA family ATPase n=1 Tax=Geomicrobium sp. JCM 19039 TaxID=1460636 RepID=UPI00045F43EE|nr:AAA family ATPase [Geomicrobium sp. JCM 19039]GAK10715.1 hypothetical protein JCM19039_350 [Geomicrobium sp. JCM 19039]
MILHSLSIQGFRRHLDTNVICSDTTFLIGSNNAGKSSVLKAIEYLLNDTKKINNSDFCCILNEDNENIQISDEVTLTAEFKEVPVYAHKWKGFNKQRMFKSTEDESYSIFYRKTYRPNQNCKVEMKQYKSTIKEAFNGCTSIQDYVDAGLDEDTAKQIFPEKKLTQKLTDSDKKILKDEGIEDIFDINYDEIEWFENPGGISPNVSHRLPKFLLIADNSKSEVLSGQSGPLMSTLKQLFEDVRDESDNFKQAQHYLDELAKELNPDDTESDFYDLLSGLNKVVGDVFPETSFLAKANLSNADEVIKPTFDVQLGSNIVTSVDYQGAGVIRSAIFAMLRYRNIRENKKKQSGEYIRPLIIAFEEPEIYLHPQAAKQMRDTIYDLAKDKNNQIICTTHSPYMIDLSKSSNQVLNAFHVENTTFDHEGEVLPFEQVYYNPFNISEAFKQLVENDQSYIKMLLKIDDNIAKIFFSKNVLIIEGDTEDVVIKETMARMPEEMYKEFSYNWEVIRARGKATIISLIKYLKALGITPYVIHDRDKGTARAEAFNQPIVDAAGFDQVIILEECMEDLLGYTAPKNNKPYTAYNFINKNWGDSWDDVNVEWRNIIGGLITQKKYQYS